MKLTIALAADYASVEQATGKLNVLGVFTRINAPRFPATHPRLALVAQIRPELGDHTNQRNLKVLLVDSDGVELLQIAGSFRLPHADSGPRPDFNIVLELNNLIFPHPGEYEFQISTDDENLGDIPLELVKAPSSE